MRKSGTKNKVLIAGAGPGAVDLITLRCLNALKEADLVIYAGSLVNPEILRYSKAGCRILDSATMSLEEIVCEIRKSFMSGGKVLRLHTGDPAVYGATAEQMIELDRLKIPYEIIPGVSSVFAAAAALKTELTTPDISQTVILTRQAGRTPVPRGQEVKNLARHKATLVLFLSAPLMDELADDLISGGYPKETPVAVVYRASWENQRIVRGTLADIPSKLKKATISRQAIIFVGNVLDKRNWNRSKLYDASFAHGYRGATASGHTDAAGVDCTQSFNGSVAVYALTSEGVSTAGKLAGEIPNCTSFVPARFKNMLKGIKVSTIKPEGFGAAIKENWLRFDGHIFVMAAGIVVRHIAPLIEHKACDPAVVVCDQDGNYAVSLLGGHIGGANRLAEDTARILRGQAVITTATDSKGLVAFDEMAAREGFVISNPPAIKKLNTMLLEGEKIAVVIPRGLYDKYYSGNKKIVLFSSLAAVRNAGFAGVVTTSKPGVATDRIPTLYIKKVR